MKIKILLLFVTVLTTNLMSSQNAITVAGGNGSSTAGNVSYSIGQSVYITDLGSNGSVSQGVQQPYEISTVLSSNMAKGINLVLTVFPNPTSNFITLKVEDYTFQTLNLQMTDINGKIVYTQKTSINETKIDIGNFPSALYFLKVSDENAELKTFKILKK